MCASYTNVATTVAEYRARRFAAAGNRLHVYRFLDLQANIEENLAVRVENEQSRSIRPDLHIAEDSAIAPSTGAVVQVAVAEPLLVPRPAHLERHVEIIDQAGRVITAIEFLNPWNKVGLRGREQYMRKQLNYLDAGVNLVEIDLVRQGDYTLAAPLDEMPHYRRTPYLVCVYRTWHPTGLRFIARRCKSHCLISQSHCGQVNETSCFSCNR